jgi:ATP-dependent Clp protease ATP-binding subunit ClpB
MPDTWTERERLQRNKERKYRLEEAKHELEVAQRKGDYEAASRLRYATIPDLEREIPAKGNDNGAMLSERVTSDDIARVVARATGIPVQSLLKGERERLVHVLFSPHLRRLRRSMSMMADYVFYRWKTR